MNFPHQRLYVLSLIGIVLKNVRTYNILIIMVLFVSITNSTTNMKFQCQSNIESNLKGLASFYF